MAHQKSMAKIEWAQAPELFASAKLEFPKSRPDFFICGETITTLGATSTLKETSMVA